MMSTLPPSMNGGASQIEWIRSPVAIEMSWQPEPGERGRVLGRDGLLDPAWGIRLECDRDLGGDVRREPAVHLDHQVDILPDGLAYSGDDRECPPAGRSRQSDARGAERV